ncbi:MAG: hypothetical protein DDT26_02121 [Dehalococcoidia bacterium]|nr:hypothetical protein [Chloroflexota bacterium]MBT9166274.1 hypothetical protein [Chloroflexota bacterium]
MSAQSGTVYSSSSHALAKMASWFMMRRAWPAAPESQWLLPARALRGTLSQRNAANDEPARRAYEAIASVARGGSLARLMEISKGESQRLPYHVSDAGRLSEMLSIHPKTDFNCLEHSFWVAAVLGSMRIACELYLGSWIPTFNAHAWVVARIDGGVLVDDDIERVVHYAPMLRVSFPQAQ